MICSCMSFINAVMEALNVKALEEIDPDASDQDLALSEIKRLQQSAARPDRKPIFIPDNDHGVKPGYYTIPDIVRLLRKHHVDPNAVHFIADMME